MHRTLLTRVGGLGALPACLLAQVGAATPMIEGVFAILRGCGGVVEERLLSMVMGVMGGSPAAPRWDEADPGRRGEVQASRVALMASLVERVLVAHEGDKGSGEDKITTLPARRLQVRRLQAELLVLVAFRVLSRVRCACRFASVWRHGRGDPAAIPGTVVSVMHHPCDLERPYGWNVVLEGAEAMSSSSARCCSLVAAPRHVPERCLFTS